MIGYVLNRSELSQYSLLRSQVKELDDKIRDADVELAELDTYNINISPVLTGLPGSTGKRDKIAEFLITLEIDRNRLNAAIALLTAERTALKYEMHKIIAAVNRIPNKQLQDIIKQHYFDGESITKVAQKNHLSEFTVYKKLNKFLGGCWKQSRK
jgi:hypothetical protein